MLYKVKGTGYVTKGYCFKKLSIPIQVHMLLLIHFITKGRGWARIPYEVEYNISFGVEYEWEKTDFRINKVHFYICIPST